MRTTVAVDETLLLAAKAAARRRGYTLSRLIEDALHRELARHGRVRTSEMPVSLDPGGPRPGPDLRSSRALLDLIEPSRAADQQRSRPT